METNAGTAPHRLAWIAAIALILLCGTGVAGLMGWIPSWSSDGAARVEIIGGANESNA